LNVRICGFERIQSIAIQASRFDSAKTTTVTIILSVPQTESAAALRLRTWRLDGRRLEFRNAVQFRGGGR